jgi:hypothetical protein
MFTKQELIDLGFKQQGNNLALGRLKYVTTKLKKGTTGYGCYFMYNSQHVYPRLNTVKDVMDFIILENQMLAFEAGQQWAVDAQNGKAPIGFQEWIKQIKN